MSTSLQLLNMANDLIPVANSFTDTVNNKITAWTGISKVGIPVIVGIVAFFMMMKASMKVGRVIGLSIMSALAVYITVGGGMQDLGLMGKSEITSAPAIIQEQVLPAQPASGLW
ncbi:MAG: hypothetical protein L0G87_00415 [Renibacterium salmoninarum]|nr:hypothetical protein [Renibacterium salmoninarum]